MKVRWGGGVGVAGICPGARYFGLSVVRECGLVCCVIVGGVWLFDEDSRRCVGGVVGGGFSDCSKPLGTFRARKDPGNIFLRRKSRGASLTSSRDLSSLFFLFVLL